MHLAKSLLISLIVPFLAAAILLLPLHGALVAANYLIYLGTGHASTILAHRFDPFYQLGTYQQLLGFWQQHQTELPFFRHTLPLIGIPAAIALLALFACYRFLRSMKERFAP